MTLSRRRFLQATGLVALSATLPVAGCAPRRYTTPDLSCFTPGQFAALDAASRRLVPRMGSAPGAGELEIARAADRLWARANPTLQADLRQLLTVFEELPAMLGGAPFSQRSPAAQDAYLRAWETSALWPARQGFAALNKLVATLFYMDPRSWPSIGYQGPWIGRIDAGLGLDNQQEMPAPVNPHVFARHPA